MLTALDLPLPDSPALPGRTSCPGCRKPRSLSVHADLIYGGHWYHCPGCGLAGDDLDLARARWPMDVEALGLRLRRSGLILPVELQSPAGRARRRHEDDYRRKVLDFWAEARAAPCPHDNPTWAHVQRQLGLRSDRAVRDRLSPLVGYTNLRRLRAALSQRRPRYEAVLEPERCARRRLRRRAAESGDEILVVPCWDLPGRIAGFLVLGRVEFRYQPIPVAGGRRSAAAHEAGLAFLPALLGQPTGDVFCVADLAAACRLQARQAVLGRPLPVVVPWADGKFRTALSWAQLGLSGDRLIFWGPPGGEALALARAAGGRLVPDWPRGNIRDYLSGAPPQALLERLRRAAVPWDEALERAVLESEPAAAEALVLGLGLGPAGLDTFLKGCRRAAREKLAGLRHPAALSVRVGRRTVTEADGRWSCGSEVIADTLLKLDRAVHCHRSGEVHYEGRIVHGGRSLDFRAPVGEIEADAWRFVRRRAVAGRLCVPVLDPAWARRAWLVAQRLSRPEPVRGFERIGWDPDLGAFVFPNFAVVAGGAVLPAPAALLPDERPPGLFLEPTDGLSAEDRAALAGGSPAAWALAALAIHNLLAPVLGHEPLNLALVGPTAQAAGRAAALAVGCHAGYVQAHWPYRRRLARVREDGRLHDWPMLLTGTADVAAGWDGGAHLVNTVCPTTELAAAVLAVNGPWATLELSPAGPAAVGPAGRLAVAYLIDLCRRGMEVPGSGALLDRLLLDLQTWADGPGGGGSAPAAARRAVTYWGPSRRGEAFAALVSRMLDAGVLSVLGRGVSVALAHAVPPPANASYRVAHAYECPDGAVRVPKEPFQRALRRARAPFIDDTAVDRTAGRGPEDGEIAGQPCWVIAGQWWERHVNGR